MSDRINRVLDGELERSALSEAELAELERFETAVAQTRAQRAPEARVAVSGAVAWRIARLQPAPRWLPGAVLPAWLAGQRAGAWLWQPRRLVLRPVSALAVMGALAVVPLAVMSALDTGAEAPSVERLLVQFRLGAENAEQVQLAGDFTNWQNRYELEEVAPGVWSIVIPLEPGVYDYAFVVDGQEWTLDPLAPAVADGFGGANSRVAVLAPEARL